MNEKMINLLNAHIDHLYLKYGADVLSYGTAHIVYDDFSTDDTSIEYCIKATRYCLDHVDTPYCPAFKNNYAVEVYEKILKDTLVLLEQLYTIPEEERIIFDWET